MMECTDPATQARRKDRETPWLDFVRKLVMIWGISATPQQIRLTIPSANETSSFRLQRQSSKYLSTHLTHVFFSFKQ